MTTQKVRRLLKRRIRESGLSNRKFAERWMVRDERTVRRWLAGEPIPPRAMEWLEQPPPWFPG
jgi:hypothetical protein